MQASWTRVKTKTILAIITTTIMLVGAAVIQAPVLRVDANNESELRNQINTLEEEIRESEKEAQHLHGYADTLEDTINDIQRQIKNINKQIKLTELKVAEITQELDKTRTELARQKRILGLSLREHYKIGEVTTVELFVSSDNFADFFNQREYLERVRNSIKDSSVKVAALEQDLAEQEEEQQRLLSQQTAQKKAQVAKRKEKKELLEEARGDAAAYERIVAELNKKRQKAEEELYEFLSKGEYTSLGEVKQGDRIGYLGSTGYSTGPHLHFALWNDNANHPVYEQFEDPRQGEGLKNGMIWPVDGPFYLSTPFGMVSCTEYIGCRNGEVYDVAHRAIDLAGPLKTPVVAAQSGDIIFRGWSGGLGYLVIIDHGNGYKTYYPHLCKGDQCYGYET